MYTDPESQNAQRQRGTDMTMPIADVKQYDRLKHNSDSSDDSTLN